MIKRILVKIGTNVLTRPDGLLDITAISRLVDQISILKKQGIDVVLVSSGAVGAGRSMLNIPDKVSKVVKRQVLSSIGQVKLMETYRQLFSNYQLFCAQVLSTKEDFRDRVHYLNIKNCFHALLRDNIIPIVNENDVISISELMFTDNDELAGLVAAMINADALIILSNVDGVLDRPPEEKGSKVIREIDPANKKWKKLIFPSKSSFGRGGMHTKFRVAEKAAQLGITTYIANGKKDDILLNILKDDFIGTRFIAGSKISNVKKWIAYNAEAHKGSVYINAGAEEILRQTDTVSSLLPVGIIQIKGDFKKGDLLRILNQKNQAIGLGIAQYGAEKAALWIGKKGGKALVHYDYLLLD